MSGHRGIVTALLLVGVVVLGLGWALTASATVVGDGIAPAAVDAGPSIDDVVGVYQEKEKGVDYDLLSADAEKWKASGTCTITKLDAVTVNLHFETTGSTWDDVGHYGGGGIVVTGNADDATLGSTCYLQVLMLKGKPGKLKAKGTWTSYDVSEAWFESGSFSLKQTG